MIKTDRLELVEFDTKYAESLQELWSDFEVIKYTYNPLMKSVEECIERINVFIGYTDKEVMNNFIILLDGKAIGIVGSPIINKEKAEVGLYYQCVRKCWGNGYVSEAVTAFMKHITDQFPNAKFYADVVSENQASIKILKKMGFIEKDTEKMVLLLMVLNVT